MYSDKHLIEFESSAIDSGLIELNIKYLDLSWTFDNDRENDDISFVIEQLNWNTSRKNDGRLRDSTLKSVTSFGGGWHITPFFGLSDGVVTDYFRFKPDIPPVDLKKGGKLKKYLGAVGSSIRLYTPNVSESVWAVIACRYGVEKIGDNFWIWLLDHPEIPVMITEGEKKALSGLSAGYVVVSLPGIDSGYKSVFNEDGEGKHLELIPDLIALGGGGRDIQIGFDRDSDPKTIQRVSRSTQKLAKLFSDIGCQTFRVEWSDAYKGLDDFIANTKPRDLDKAIASAVNISPIPKTEQTKPNYRLFFGSSIERGLELISISDDGEEERESIGNHLQAIAYVNNPEQDSAALLLEFRTILGEVRRVTIPRCELAGEGREILGGLLGRDYSFKRRQRNLLLDYLHGLGANIPESFTVTDSSGWVGESFVLPHKTHGNERLRFRDVDPSPESITEFRGTLQGWKDGVAARCAGNSRLILALGASFAAPLLPIADVESGGFHLVGVSSQGKTTLLSVAASVTGVKDIPLWRTTTNGLEAIATAFNHLCLPIDEINQADPREVGNMAYMLANGQGKARMTKNLTNRKPKKWRLIMLSSGEFTIGTYMAQANISQTGGQEVRLPDVPAVPDGAIYGCFETIQDADDAISFISSLEAETKKHHGVALDAFLERLVLDVKDPKFGGFLSKQVYLVAAKLAEGTVDNVISRVAKRFALTQVALGLAHRYDLLPFPISDIDWAISTCFHAWLHARGGDGSIEVKNAIKRIEHLFVTNEFSDRVFTLPNNNDRPVRNLLAYRQLDLMGETEEFWVPPSVFDKEICEGVNKTELVKELQRLELLELSTEGRTLSRTIGKKRERYYVFRGGKCVFGVDRMDRMDRNSSNPDVATLTSVSECDPDDRIALDRMDRKLDSDPCDPVDGSHSGSQFDPLNLDTAIASDLRSERSMRSTPKTHFPEEENKKINNLFSSLTSLKVGDIVLYIGTDKALKRQLKGVLKVHSISLDGACCYKEDRSLSSWIPFEDLQ
jgi:putative DNA primase/helicase